MRSKIPLILMEQMVMLLVFALAAALCLQAFVKSDQMSGRSHDKDRAVTLVQEAAETVRHCGSVEGAAKLLEATYLDGHFRLEYDEYWNPGGACYNLAADEIPSGVPGLGMAKVAITASGDAEDVLFAVTVAWQEEITAEQDAAVLQEVEQDGT